MTETRVEFFKRMRGNTPQSALSELELTKRAVAVGSGRKVYNVKNVDGLVVKKAYNQFGVEQMNKEIEIYNDIAHKDAFQELKDVMPRIYGGSIEYQYGSKDFSGCFLIIEKLKPLPYESGSTSILTVCAQYGVHPNILVLTLKMLEKKYNLHRDDLLNASAWGTTPKGALKILDWGTTKDMYNKYFED